MLKTESITLGDNVFDVRQLGFSASRKTAVKLAKLLGPSLVSMLKDAAETFSKKSKGKDSTQKEDLLQEILGSLKVEKILDGILEALTSLEDSDLAELTETFAKVTEFGPAGVDRRLPLDAENRELIFGGDGLAHYFRWLIFCVRLNYNGFFSVLSALSPGLPTEK